MRTLAEVLNNLTWGGSKEYPAYLAVMKSKKGDAEKAAEKNAAEDRKFREQQVGKVTEMTADLAGGSVESTGMYKRMLATSTDDTVQAFNNVRAKRARAARAAGFGYAQPAVQGDKTSVDAMEAEEVGRLPNEVYGTVQQARMGAAGMNANLAGMYSGSAGNNLQIQATAEEQRKARRAKMWGKLAGAGLGVAGVLTGQPQLAAGGFGMAKG